MIRTLQRPFKIKRGWIVPVGGLTPDRRNLTRRWSGGILRPAAGASGRVVKELRQRLFQAGESFRGVVVREVQGRGEAEDFFAGRYHNHALV